MEGGKQGQQVFKIGLSPSSSGGAEEGHASLLEEVKEALVVSDLLSSVQQGVGFLLGEGVGALMVLDVVHDLVDAVLMSSEEGSGHNWVQAHDVSLDLILIELEVIAHPTDGLEHTSVVGAFHLDPLHDFIIAIALLVVARQLDPLYLLPHAGHGAEAGAERVGKLVSDVCSGRALKSCRGSVIVVPVA